MSSVVAALVGPLSPYPAPRGREEAVVSLLFHRVVEHPYHEKGCDECQEIRAIVLREANKP